MRADDATPIPAGTAGMAITAGTPDKWLLGSGTLLRWAVAAWSEVEPGLRLHAVEVGQDDEHRFDTAAIGVVSPDGAPATAFVAWGPQFLNFRRLELMGALKARGLRLPPLVCRGAIVAADVSLGENVAVGAGSIVGAGSRLGYNAVVGAGCILGPDVQIGTSAWIADGVQIGAGCRIGANATLGRGVILDDGVSIGRQSVLDQPGRRAVSLPDRHYLTPAFPEGARVVRLAGERTTR